MKRKLEISHQAVDRIVTLLGADARTNRAIIVREDLDVRSMPGKRYLANAMISEAALMDIHGQVRS